MTTRDPWSSEFLERTVLAGSLIYASHAALCLKDLTIEDFTVKRHRALWWAINEIFEQHGTADVSLVADLLHSRGWLAPIGGLAWLGTLIEESMLPTSDRSLSARIAALKGMTHRRIMGQATKESLHHLEEGEDPEVVIGRLLSHYAPSRDRDPTDGALEALSGHRGVYRTGLKTLDEAIGGIGRGRLLVIGGRSGEGKTSLCLALANRFVQRGIPVVYFAQELSPDLMTVKFACLRRQISYRRIDWDLATEHERHEVVNEVQAIRDLKVPIVFPPQARASSAQVAAEAVRQRFARNVEMIIVIVDHLQRMGLKRPEHVRIETAEHARQLKELAKRERLGVIAVSQLRKPPPSQRPSRPRVSDLAETGTIEQEADTILMLWREPGTEGVMTIFVEKRRDGGALVHPLRLGLDPESGMIWDLSPGF